MKLKYILPAICCILFFGVLFCFAASASSDAEGIREGVLRFHVVANSDSNEDQQNKLAVRDGITELCSSLFGSAANKSEAMQSAGENSGVISEKAEEILKGRGCIDSVTVTVRKRYFPTRNYDGVSLPAGVYDTVDILIGEAKGQNFWCVLFPDICVGASTEKSNKDKLSAVLDGGSLKMTTSSKEPSVKLKFKTVELIEKIKNIFSR